MATQSVAVNPVSVVERVVRALSTFVVALPFLVAGLMTLAQGDAPAWTGIVLIAVAAVLGLTGLYMTLVVVQPSPRLIEGENVIVVRSPTMKPAYARLAISMPFLLTAWYLNEYTFSPYVYPFGALLVGMFFFFGGAYRYWINQRTAYYVTSRRVVRIYEFLWLHTTEIPVSRIVSISESRGFFESLTGRGSVIVASGVGSRQTVRLSDIDDPGEVADSLRATIE